MFSFQYPGQISIQKKGFQRVNTEMPGERISRAQLHSSGINGEFGQVTPWFPQHYSWDIPHAW